VRVRVLGAGLLVPALLIAQQPTGYAAADSAAVARAAFRAANAAIAKHDTAAALRAVDRAAAAWPTQEGYLWARTIVAAMARDTARVVSALNAYADNGFGRDVASDARLAPLLSLSGAAGAAKRIHDNFGPLVRSTIIATTLDSAFYPEGVDANPRTGTFYIASVRHRTIAEVSPAGKSLRELIPRGTPRVGSILGVRVDAARGFIWATTAGLPQMEGYEPRDSAIAALLRIRISDGVIDKRWDLAPSPQGHTLGDLAIGANGDVYVTDSREPVLYILKRGADTLQRIVHPLFHNLQGMAPAADGRTLYVADWSHGLLRVDLATRQVTRLADAPHSSSLGCDGIVLDGNTIIAVQNGSSPQRVMRFTLNAAGTAIARADVLDRNTLLAPEPTIGTMSNGAFVYVANSQWDEYTDAGTPKPSAVLHAPVLLRIAKGN